MSTCSYTRVQLVLSVCRYCLVRETKKPSFVRLDQRTNEELKTQTKMLCEVRKQAIHYLYSVFVSKKILSLPVVVLLKLIL